MSIEPFFELAAELPRGEAVLVCWFVWARLLGHVIGARGPQGATISSQQSPSTYDKARSAARGIVARTEAGVRSAVVCMSADKALRAVGVGHEGGNRGGKGLVDSPTAPRAV